MQRPTVLLVLGAFADPVGPCCWVGLSRDWGAGSIRDGAAPTYKWHTRHASCCSRQGAGHREIASARPAHKATSTMKAMSWLLVRLDARPTLSVTAALASDALDGGLPRAGPPLRHITVAG